MTCWCNGLQIWALCYFLFQCKAPHHCVCVMKREVPYQLVYGESTHTICISEYTHSSQCQTAHQKNTFPCSELVRVSNGVSWTLDDAPYWIYVGLLNMKVYFYILSFAVNDPSVLSLDGTWLHVGVRKFEWRADPAETASYISLCLVQLVELGKNLP